MDERREIHENCAASVGDQNFDRNSARRATSLGYESRVLDLIIGSSLFWSRVGSRQGVRFFFLFLLEFNNFPKPLKLCPSLYRREVVGIVIEVEGAYREEYRCSRRKLCGTCCWDRSEDPRPKSHQLFENIDRKSGLARCSVSAAASAHHFHFHPNPMAACLPRGRVLSYFSFV